MSLPERVLWRQLRRRPANLKFRRQHPIGIYTLDFYCASAKLCIEVDGEGHDRGDQPIFDQSRTDWLTRHGVQTLRVTARDVLDNLEGAVIHIVEVAGLRLPLHQPLAGPPPRAGEEQEVL